MTTIGGRLAGKRILIAEDDWFIAKGLARDIRNAGAEVVGPVPSIAEALALIGAEQLGGAVLDVNLRGEMAYPVADLPAERGVPFVLATGYGLDALPERYRDVPRCAKPVGPGALAEALLQG